MKLSTFIAQAQQELAKHGDAEIVTYTGEWQTFRFPYARIVRVGSYFDLEMEDNDIPGTVKSGA